MINISVVIPYADNSKLAFAYNETMNNSPTNWVVLLDWDIMILTPNWIDCVKKVIDKNKKNKVGIISCLTNRTASPTQRIKYCPHSDNMYEHFMYAQWRFNKYNYKTKAVNNKLSGHMIVTNKKVWGDVGGFNENINQLKGVDNDYSQKVKCNGYKQLIMQGVYGYHLANKKRQWIGEKQWH